LFNNPDQSLAKIKAAGLTCCLFYILAEAIQSEVNFLKAAS